MIGTRGALISATVAATLAVVLVDRATYDRADYLSRWPDADGDCQNLRAELLIARSQEPVRFASARACRVVGGVWRDSLTGSILRDAGALDVDHVVALSEAHRSGAATWHATTRQAFAVDTRNLVLTAASVNRSKGDRDPATWWPTVDGCAYGARWLEVKARYRLTFDAAEVRALIDQLRDCEGVE